MLNNKFILNNISTKQQSHLLGIEVNKGLDVNKDFIEKRQNANYIRITRVYKAPKFE